jgi:cytidylate kinase
VKVYVSVDPRVAAERLLKANRQDQQYNSVEEAMHHNAERMALETKQHLALYGVDSHDLKNFDIVVNSSHSTPEQVVEEIVSRLPR